MSTIIFFEDLTLSSFIRQLRTKVGSLTINETQSFRRPDGSKEWKNFDCFIENTAVAVFISKPENLSPVLIQHEQLCEKTPLQREDQSLCKLPT